MKFKLNIDKRVNDALRFVAACFLSVLAQGVVALGLGELEHKSYLGQPLSGEIPIVGKELLPVENIIVRELSARDAADLGIDLIVSPYKMYFSPNTINGVVTSITVYSKEAIAEPYLSILVELRWPQGKVYREYALLFDAPPARSETIQSRRADPEPIKPQVSRSENTSSRRSNSAEIAFGDQYTVKSGDTLSGIVSRINKPSDVSDGELMQAVFEQNPQAFIQSNINSLKAGARLRVPSAPVSIASSESGLPSSSTAKNIEVGPSTEQDEAASGRSSESNIISGRLSLSDGGRLQDQGKGAEYEAPLIREQIDGTQEMIDMLVRENQDLRERIDRIETSEYLTTLSELVEVQRKQIEELREEFGFQANAPSNSVGESDETATSTSPPISTAPKSADTPLAELSFSQKLAQNFWSFISLIVLAFVILIALCFYALRKWSDNQKEQAEYTQYRRNIESKVDLDSFIGIQESASIEPAANDKFDRKQKIASFNANVRKKEEEKRIKDEEVKARIRVKTNEYNAAPIPSSSSAESNTGMNVVIGMDEEVNELLSMAKIYCSAGKYSEARAILSAQHREDSDPRLIDALEQINKLEEEGKA